MPSRHLVVVALLSGTLAAFSPAAQGEEFAWHLPPWAEPPPVPADNPMSRVKVELGRRLFYEVLLSGPGYTACSSCHEAPRGFSERRPTSFGASGEHFARRSMRLANVGYLRPLTWADPRLASLELQALQPLFGEHPVEMMTFVRDEEVLQRLADNVIYSDLFAVAFPETPGGGIEFPNVAKALAAFERTMISRNAPYDRYKFGGEAAAISDAAKRGEALFVSPRLNCGGCHGGALFTDAAGGSTAPYHNTGLYNEDGRGGLPRGNQGLIEVTGRREDMGRFRTPSLRNIAVSAPYMHDGSIATLGEVIDHYAAGGRAAQRGARSPLASPLVAGFAISAEEKADLIAFLESLTDRGFLDNEALQTPYR
jgi:cytochrome c peroxidase